MADRPAFGGRVLLELEAQDDQRIAYRLTLDTKDAAWTGRAEVLAADGAVTMEGLDGAPPWLVDAARAFVRSLWTARRGAEPAPWPRRVLRWRPAPALPGP